MSEATGAVTAAEAEGLFAGLAAFPALLVAVSGGPDSVALLALLADWGRLPDRPIILAATVDHGLRHGSAAEAEGVAALCAQLGVPHATLRWKGAAGASVQERARAARYALLTREAARIGAAAIVTAHTRDDQAETVLMRIAHGSGPAGLAGMRPRSERGDGLLLRPLLGIAKARLVATAQARDLSFVTDPSNLDPRFERARWRALMPALAEAGLDAARLATLAARQARAEAALAEAAALMAREMMPESLPAETVLRLDIAKLRDAPAEIGLRVLGLALVRMGGEGEEPGRLARLETCFDALIQASAACTPMTRTLSGCVLSLEAGGRLTIRRELARRRGLQLSLPQGAMTAPLSLGKGVQPS